MFDFSTENFYKAEGKDRSEILFGVGVAIVLVLLAILSVASGVGPNVDPNMWPAP
jgi:hypothetical protein